MKKKIRAAAVAALAAASICAVSASSQAATVDVHPNLGSSFTYGVAPAGRWSGALGNWSMNLGIGTAGSILWERTPSSPLPADINIDTLYSNYYYSTGGAGYHQFAVRMCYGGASGWNTGAGGGCAGDQLGVLASTNSGEYASVNTGMACGSSNATIAGAYRCGGYQLEVNQPQAFGTISGGTTTTATLSDYVLPNIDRTYNSNTLASGNWLRGVISGGLSSGDGSGVGVATSGLTIDGTLAAGKSYSCDYNQWVPCPSSGTWSPSIDTTAYADGVHNAVLSTSDAAANTRTSAFALKIDNTRPDTPSSITPQTSGEDGWSATNSFDVAWTNGSEVAEDATHSGLEKVIVDVNPTDGSQSDPAPVTIPLGSTVAGISATATSVSDVTVPAIGHWTLRIALDDKAGNRSAVGDGSPGSADSDISIGYDPSAPPKANGNANGWISRDELAAGAEQQTWNAPIIPLGSAPVCGYNVSVSDNQDDPGGTAINVHSPTTSWTFPSNLTEGTHWSHIRAINCSLVPSTATENLLVHVDLTDPTPKYNGVEEGRWYKNGQELTISGIDALSGMSGALPTETDARRGAYIAYTINGAGPADSTAPRGGSANIKVAGEGFKTLSFSPVDFAGNRAKPTTVNFGIDATEPEGYLAVQNPDKPTLIRAALSDAVSGIANAELQYRDSAGDWKLLPTILSSFSGGQIGDTPQVAIAEARFPDSKLPPGTYSVRAVAIDQAGNTLITDRDSAGNVFTVTNPMRRGVGVSAFVYRGLHKCKRSVNTKCVKKKRGRVFLVGGKKSTSVGYRRAGIVQGYLTTLDYAPLAKQPIAIYTQSQGRPEILAGTSSTRLDGSYYFRLKPGVSRKVRVVFAGTELLQGAEDSVRFGTAAKLTFRVSRRHVESNGKLTFTGRVTSVDAVYPPSGKIVALQFLTGGKWRPAVALVRTDSKGNFKVAYRFDRIPRNVTAKIRFRIMAPAELGWSHVTSSSRTKIVRVN